MSKLDNNFVTIRKAGGFYQVFDDDSYILFYFFNYKISNSKSGFPHSSLNKVINILEDNKISYIIKEQKEIKKDFKKLNKYNKFLKLGKESYNDFLYKENMKEIIFNLDNDKLEKIFNYIKEVVNE